MKILWTCILFGCIALPGMSDDLLVPAQYPTIGDALLAAEDGDVIRVAAGLYHEHLSITKAVVIIGENKATTLIDGDHWGDVISISHDDVKITHCTIRNGDRGVVFSSAKGLCLFGNTIKNCAFGVHLNKVSRVILKENLIMNHDSCGVFSVVSAGPYSNIQVLDNILLDNTQSLRLGNLEHSSLCGNDILSAKTENTGINIATLSDTSIRENKISNQDTGIRVTSGSNFVIAHNSLTDTSTGLELSDIESAHIFRNEFLAGGTCMRISGVHRTVFLYNKMWQACHGFHMKEAPNGKCLVLHNSVRGCYTGFVLDEPEDLDMIGNTIVDCSKVGIELSSPFRCRIMGNLVNNCTEKGMQILYGNTCSILCNTVAYSGWIGLTMVGGEHILYNNNFLFNSQNVYCTSPVGNHWDMGNIAGGNYWSDYRGVDLNGDGFGDTPYKIPGSTEQDNFPLMMPH